MKRDWDEVREKVVRDKEERAARLVGQEDMVAAV
jgi:hypothetical protein